MATSYSMSPEQRQVWIDQLPETPHGAKTKIASALEEAGHGTLSSWKTVLSSFFKGGEKGLRAVFEHDGRLAVVAKQLGVRAGALRRWLDVARGLPVADEPGMCRIPGFEDYGAFPISDVFFPPRLREARLHLPHHGLVSSHAGGNIDLDLLLRVAAADAQEPEARALVIVGARGSGRTPTLEALCSRLLAAGHEVVRHDQRGEPRSVVIADDLDELDVVGRASLVEGVRQHDQMLVCAILPGSSIEDLPHERAVVTLARGDDAWARDYLEHLEQCGRTLLARQVATEPLRAWISEAPDATTFLDGVDVLGLAARHVADGGEVPVPLHALVPIAVTRWAKLLRARRRGPEALTVELCLAPALASLAADACRRGGWSHSIADVARALVQEAGKRLSGDAQGTWGQLGAPGMLAIVDALVDVGAFARHGDRLAPGQGILQSAALGTALASPADDPELLSNAIIDPRWHDALVVSAERAQDSGPLLLAIASLPVEVRVHAYAAVTRLLAATPDCSDRPLLNRWFRRCLHWWASLPPESRATTMTIGGAPTAERQRPPEALIGGTCPLLVLSRASRLRRRDLTGPTTVEEVLHGADLPADELRFLAVLVRSPTEESTQDALLIGAPFQADLVLDPENWHRFPSTKSQGPELPAGLTREEYATWWRTAAAERIRHAAHGRAILAGTREGWSVSWGMSQPDGAGASIWGDAIFGLLGEGDPGAVNAFADAVAHLVTWGGRSNFETLSSIWARLRTRDRRSVREQVAKVLPPPGRWYVHEEFNTWVLRELLETRAMQDAWSSWTDAQGHRGGRIPWKAFAVSGLPASYIVEWAADTWREHQEAAASVSASRVPSTGGGMVLQLQERSEVPQVAALNHLLESDQASVLEALLDAPFPWSVKALQRLDQVAPERSRRIRLEWAAEEDGPFRVALLGRIAPRRGEFELWTALAETAESWQERLVRWMQAAVAVEGDDRAAALEDIVSLFECLTSTKEVAKEQIAAHLTGSEVASDRSPFDQAQQLVSEIHGRVPVLLEELGRSLASAPDPEDDLSHVVLRVLDGPLRHFVRGGSMWLVAYRALGVDYIVSRLEGRMQTEANAPDTVETLRACATVGLFDALVRQLLRHEVLGRPATQVFAERINPQRVDVMREALEGQPLLGADERLDQPTAALARKLAGVEPSAAMEWAEQALVSVEPTIARAWWEILLPTLPPGAARRRAVREWARVVG